MLIRAFKTGVNRKQASFLPRALRITSHPTTPVRAIDAFVDALDLDELGFKVAALAREAGRNLELIWLLRQLRPCFRTIANFRKDNWAALKAANRTFVMMARELNLIGGEVVAIDGAFFHGDASRGSIKTHKRLMAQLAEIDQDIEDYGATFAAGDAAEDDGAGAGVAAGADAGTAMTALMDKRAAVATELDRLAASGQTQVSRTDRDARLLTRA